MKIKVKLPVSCKSYFIRNRSVFGSMYSRMNQIKFVEDSFGSFLNTLIHPFMTLPSIYDEVFYATIINGFCLLITFAKTSLADV